MSYRATLSVQNNLAFLSPILAQPDDPATVGNSSSNNPATAAATPATPATNGTTAARRHLSQGPWGPWVSEPGSVGQVWDLPELPLAAPLPRVDAGSFTPPTPSTPFTPSSAFLGLLYPQRTLLQQQSSSVAPPPPNPASPTPSATQQLDPGKGPDPDQIADAVAKITTVNDKPQDLITTVLIAALLMCCTLAAHVLIVLVYK